MGNISHHVWRWERMFELTQLILRVLTRIGIKQGSSIQGQWYHFHHQPIKFTQFTTVLRSRFCSGHCCGCPDTVACLRFQAVKR